MGAFGFCYALLPVGQYALLSRYCPLGNTRFVSRCVALLHTRFGRAVARWAIRALAFLPFCASSALASPSGRRERTLVRPLALGLAALNTHQTDKKAFVTRYVALLHTRFYRPIARWAIRALYRAIARWAIRALGAAMCSLSLRAYAARGPQPTATRSHAIRAILGVVHSNSPSPLSVLAVVMALCALVDWR